MVLLQKKFHYIPHKNLSEGPGRNISMSVYNDSRMITGGRENSQGQEHEEKGEKKCLSTHLSTLELYCISLFLPQETRFECSNIADIQLQVVCRR